MERQWRVVGGIIEEKQGQPNHTRKMRELERHDNRTACLLECVYSTVKIACVDFICNQNIVTVLEICGRVRQNGWWQFQFSSIQSSSVELDSLRPHGLQHAGPPCPSPTPRAYPSLMSLSDAIQPSHPLSSPSPPALNLAQHQGLFQ